jgi:hypothetical protein
MNRSEQGGRLSWRSHRVKKSKFAQGGRANPSRMFAALSLVAGDPF